MEKNTAKVLGIDIGTSSVKACLIDVCTETVVEKKCSIYQFETESKILNDSFAEQNTKIIIDTIQSTIGSIERNLLIDVKAITVCGQMHGVVLWRANAWNYKNGEYSINESNVSNLYTWQDKRCDENFLKSLPKSDVPVASGYGCATIFWLNTYDSQSLSHYSKCGTIMDLLVAMICDLQEPVMSLQNAASFGFCDPKNSTWNTKSLNERNFPVHLLPKIVDSEATEHSLISQWLCIKPKTPVFTAFGDTQCAVYAAIRDLKCRAVLNAGTSMQMCLSVNRDDTNEIITTKESIDYFPYFDKQYLAVAASLNGGNVLQCFIDKLSEFIHLITNVKVDANIVWNRIMTAAIESDALRTGHQLQISPCIYGERYDPQLKGSIAGISNSTNICQLFASICRSLIENIFSLISIDLLKQYEIESLIVTGNAFAANPVLRTALLDYITELGNKSNIYIDVTFDSELDANIGAALLGASLLKKKLYTESLINCD